MYLDEYIRRRDALMSRLTSLVSMHRHTGDLRFVAAGGDGTVSWVAELVSDACAMVGTRNVPPIAVLSLGTGNELARVTGWGAALKGTDSLRQFARDVACGRVVGVDSWLWRAVPLALDELGVPNEDVERVASELARSKLGWHRSREGGGGGGGGALGMGGDSRHGVGFGSAMFLNSVLEPLPDSSSGGGSTGDSSEENAYISRASVDGTVLPPRNGRCISPLHAGLEGRKSVPKVWDAKYPDSSSPKASPRTSVRYDFDLARGLAMESDDLPHHPELLFAPPPMTPPGAVRANKPRSPGSSPKRIHGPGGGGIHGPPEGDTNETISSDDKSTNGGRDSFGTKLPILPTHHRRSSSVISVGSQHGPAINGVGFGRLNTRRGHARSVSGGGSMDFDAAGFGFEDEASPCASDAEGEDSDELEVATVTKTSVCFFSVGFDASIAMQFHQLRERTPCCADSVSKVVAGHGLLGITELFSSRKYLRPGVMSLRVDGVDVPIPEGAKTVQFFNIHSSATGIDFFGSHERSTRLDRLQEYSAPNVGDGLVEVVATFGVAHLAAIRLGFGHSRRLAQGSVIEVVLREALPVQVDGEPWLQPPAVIRMELRGKIPFVLGRGDTKNVPRHSHVRRPSCARNEIVLDKMPDKTGGSALADEAAVDRFLKASIQPAGA